MSLFNRNHATEIDPRAESARQVDEIIADRRDRVAALVAETEALLQHARAVITDDGEVGKAYQRSVIQPWADAIQAVFGAFRDEVVGNLPALREAGRLVRSGDVRIAVAKYGPLLANLRRLEAKLGQLKRERPVGIARVGVHTAMQVRPAPSIPAQVLLETLFAGAPASDFGLLTTDDILSRLRIEEGIAPEDFTIHLGTRVVYCWNHEAVLAAEGVPA